jgi:predicted nucleic acid-binding protein
VKYFTREAGWEKVREVLIDGVVTLDLAIKEVANALWKRVVRGEMGYDTALTIIRTLLEGAIPVVDERDYLARAFELAAKHKVTVYDALFVALALEKNTELVTSDKLQAAAAEKAGVRVVVV